MPIPDSVASFFGSCGGRELKGTVGKLSLRVGAWSAALEVAGGMRPISMCMGKLSVLRVWA